MNLMSRKSADYTVRSEVTRTLRPRSGVSGFFAREYFLNVKSNGIARDFAAFQARWIAANLPLFKRLEYARAPRCSHDVAHLK